MRVNDVRSHIARRKMPLFLGIKRDPSPTQPTTNSTGAHSTSNNGGSAAKGARTMSEIKIGSFVKHKPEVWGWPGDVGRVETLTEYRAEDGGRGVQAFVRIEPGYGYSTSVDTLVL